MIFKDSDGQKVFSKKNNNREVQDFLFGIMAICFLYYYKCNKYRHLFDKVN